MLLPHLANVVVPVDPAPSTVSILFSIGLNRAANAVVVSTGQPHRMSVMAGR